MNPKNFWSRPFKKFLRLMPLKIRPRNQKFLRLRYPRKILRLFKTDFFFGKKKRLVLKKNG